MVNGTMNKVNDAGDKKFNFRKRKLKFMSL